MRVLASRQRVVNNLNIEDSVSEVAGCRIGRSNGKIRKSRPVKADGTLCMEIRDDFRRNLFETSGFPCDLPYGEDEKNEDDARTESRRVEGASIRRQIVECGREIDRPTSLLLLNLFHRRNSRREVALRTSLEMVG